MTPFTVGEYYHVYNRGIDKRKIFFSKGDWKHFQRLMYIRNTDSSAKLNLSRIKDEPLKLVFQGDPGTLVDVVAYAMMDNHFHLLVREKVKGGVTKFMSRFMTSYSMYMNKKYDRTGPLMCRPFKTKHIDSDEYFRWLISYIHLNPIDQIQSDWEDVGVVDKRSTLKFLKEYKYSSYPDYFVDERDESMILNKEALPINIEDLEDLTEMLDEVGQYEHSNVPGDPWNI